MNEKLKQNAAELLELVANELRKHGQDVATNPADLAQESGFGIRDSWLIKIGGVVIPLKIQEHYQGGYSVMYGRRSSGRLDVSCNWVWNMELPGNSVRMKSKTFGYSKTRPATFGFDVVKIAEHLELWHHEDWNAREQVKKRKGFEGQWKEVEARLKERFPSFEKNISSDSKGIHIKLVLGEKQAAEVLMALDGPSCHVCHVALLPAEEPPICEDCHRKRE